MFFILLSWYFQQIKLHNDIFFIYFSSIKERKIQFNPRERITVNTILRYILGLECRILNVRKVVSILTWSLRINMCFYSSRVTDCLSYSLDSSWSKHLSNGYFSFAFFDLKDLIQIYQVPAYLGLYGIIILLLITILVLL